ncbi:hypothetical protein M405DRAFT_817823 [Rhizopogon salebrosus TDB-379]|nr:hypothetical protein M405DRAFT_817823 [Rhizopogon salebrosus TDB-379]
MGHTICSTVYCKLTFASSRPHRPHPPHPHHVEVALYSTIPTYETTRILILSLLSTHHSKNNRIRILGGELSIIKICQHVFGISVSEEMEREG